ncbi:MAG: trypsin-like peptidase domain-containing protein [Verrucomicrobiota bacterium]
MLAQPSRFAALLTCCILAALAAIPSTAPAQPLSISDYSAVVRVENDALVPNYRTPWNTGRTSGGSGSGFLVGENKFLTNAHVVSDSRILYIKKVGDPKPYKARILHIAHDCDLAMLEVEDYSAFEGVKPLELGGIPQLNTTVIAVGYPVGGERISVTRGVVSRIDFRPYSHSAVDYHLTIQVDAAINPGNSGGPVLQDEKVVGVAFQGYSGAVAQNVGYMIPVPVIERFLTDVEDGNYDHYVDLALSEFNILNPAQRRALKLPNDGIGVMVANVNAHGSASDVLEVGDVLLEINGHPIFSNGFVDINGEQINMNEIVERKFADDIITLKILRDEKEQEVELTLKRFLPYLIQGKQYDKTPRYLVFAGLVFQPLDLNLYAAHSIDDMHARYLFNYFVAEELYKDIEEPVVLTSVLPAAINTHLRGYAGSIVEEVNGQPIKKLADLYDALNDDEDRDYHVIKIAGQGRPIVLDANLVENAHDQILTEYKVPNDYYNE